MPHLSLAAALTLALVVQVFASATHAQPAPAAPPETAPATEPVPVPVPVPVPDSETAPAPAPAAAPAATPEAAPEAATPPPPETAPAPEATAEAAPEDEDEDEEVSALLAQMDDSAAVESVLDDASFAIYGFADFTYEKLWAEGPTAAFYPASTFFIGNLNVYLDARLDEDWRALSEIRFTYLPHGSLDVETGDVIHVTAQDYTEGLARVQTGGIEIERAWLDYAPVPWLAVRGGQWLTPYGIWNVDHGSPALIGIQKPYLNAVQMFPERQTGIALRSNFAVGSGLDMTLHLTLSNGRGAIDAYRDLDDNKALGGRAQLRYLGDFNLQLGASAYRGRYTDSVTEATIGGEELDFRLEPVVQYDELSLAGDLRVRYGGLELLSEVVVNEVAFVEGLRPGGVGGFLSTPQADLRRWGAYVLAGYHIEALLLMPYAAYDYIRDMLTTGVYDMYRAGLRFTPIPSVTLKLEYTHANPQVSLTDSGSVDALRFQAAWAFQ